MKILNNLHTWLHTRVTFTRRVRILSKEISDLIPENSRILDVGCGNGEISEMIINRKKNCTISGIETLLRDKSRIDVHKYDGKLFPFQNKSFDFVLFIDVLHHTQDIETLLGEASRVACRGIITKDHNCGNFFQKKVLRFTDWFGNRQYGVNLEYNFQSRQQWEILWGKLKLIKKSYIYNFGLYPRFTRIIFWKDLDFIVKLEFE
jgi:ubiquinone/menaquinone biosynthesis C-methylase UbiE